MTLAYRRSLVRWKLAATTGVIVTCLWSAASCSRLGAAQPKPALRISTVADPHTGLLCIADRAGLFAKHGLHVTVDYLDSERAVNKSLLDRPGQTQADFAVISMFGFARSLSQSKKAWRILAEVSSAPREFAIVSLQDRFLDKPKKVEGKILGFNPTAINEAVLDAFFNREGINRRSVHFVPLNGQQLRDQLKNRTIDAALMNEQMLAEAPAEFQNRKLTLLTITMNPVLDILLANATSVRGDLAAHQKVLQSLVEAEPYVENINERGLELLKSCYPKQSAENLKKVLDTVGFHVLASEQMRFNYGQTSEWIKRVSSSFEPVPPAFDEIFFKNALVAVMPTRVLIQ